MVEPSKKQTQPHQPPLYKSANSGSKPASPLTLKRTNSKHLYDADVSGMDSEFALHSRSRHEDDVEFQKSVSRLSGGGRHKRTSSSKHLQTKPDETLEEEVKEWEEKDAAERRKEMEELEEVRSGGDGHKAEHLGEKEKELDDKSTTRGSDLEAQISSNHSTDVESLPVGEKVERSSSGHSSQEEEDPNLVTWDGPDDPANPRNWSKNRKWVVTIIVSGYAFMSPLSSSMIAPALPIISEEFNVTNSALQSLMLSVFVLAYAIGPLFLAPLSEMYGRKIVLTASNLFFLAFTIACAVAQSSAQLTAFRFLAGLGGSAPLAIGGGSLSDLFTPDNRGQAMAVYSLCPLLGPVIGPIMGAWITQRTGKWRWIFGATCIAMGIVAVAGFILLPETYQPRILALKAAKQRKETGNDKLKTVFERDTTDGFFTRLRHNIVRPFVLIGTQPVVQAFSLIMVFLYGTMYLLLTTFNSVFQEAYNESVGIASLNYISLGLGFTLGGQIGGRGVDMIYKRFKAKNGGVGRPEYKLPLMIVTTWMLPAGMLIYGWSVQYHVHWIVPNIGAFIFGTGMMFSFLGVQNYMVDTYSLYAASALSAVAFLRSLAGFGFPLFAPAMYAKLGNGWGNSVLALVSLMLGIPAPILMFYYGPYLRSKSTYAAK